MRTPSDPERMERRVRWLSDLLDDRFRFPFTERRFGWDGLIGLVPGIGDTLTMLVSAYLMFEAWRLGAGAATLTRMAGNVGMEWVLGTIPLLGDALDFAWKANQRNVRLLEKHLDRTLARLPEPAAAPPALPEA